MSLSNGTRLRDEYLEFEFIQAECFDALKRLYLALKAGKDAEDVEHEDQSVFHDPDDSYWTDFLNEESLAWFSNTFDYDSVEGKVYQKLWNLTEPEVRLSHPMFHLPGNWDFESLLDAIFRGEYTLIDLVLESKSKGLLYFQPYAYPFGGTEALFGLIEAFGCTVTHDSYHEGPHERTESAWDYELAKQLVSRGKGFKPSPLDGWL